MQRGIRNMTMRHYAHRFQSRTGRENTPQQPNTPKTAAQWHYEANGNMYKNKYVCVLPYPTGRSLPAVCFSLVFRCRFGCAGAGAGGASLTACPASASGLDDAGVFRTCPRRYAGAFSHGRVAWTTCRRCSVVARAARGWVRGMPYFVR